MTSTRHAPQAPVIFLPHGGGPLPVLGDPGHEKLTAFLRAVPARLGQPEAILVITGHWETDVATLSSHPQPDLIYDYYGFPEASYRITYPAPGSPTLAEEIAALLANAGIEAMCDAQRGYDHGTFIPLKLMYPEASIPVVQLSVLKDMDPAKHLAMGKALASLRTRNVVIVGSGMSFHNLQDFFVASDSSRQQAEAFDAWLVETCCDPALTAAERERRLRQWTQAPAARFSHPREEHLLPLHVCYGIAQAASPQAELVFNDDVLNRRVMSALWQ